MSGESSNSINFKQDGSLGIFATISLILLLWGFCWLKSYGAFRIPQTINVVFHEVAGLNDNAAVFLDGVRVGMVDNMEWQAPHRVLLRLRVNRGKVEIPKGSKFDILTNGVVGAKYVEIILPPEAQEDKKLDALTEYDVVMGEDPVRPELALNKLAIGLSAIDIDKLESNFEADRSRLVRAADQLAKLADESMPIVKRTPELQEDVIAMSQSATKLTNNINKIVNNPNFSGDLKQTAAEARATAESLHQTMNELEQTLGDKPLRADILATMQQLRATTENIRGSMTTLQQVTNDRLLRTDVKEILAQAHADLEKVNEILKNPKYGSDIQATLANAKNALGDLDVVAQQLHQILNKRQPLLRMMVGRPGFVKTEKDKPETKEREATPKNAPVNGDAGTVVPVKTETKTETKKQTKSGFDPFAALMKPFRKDKPTKTTTTTTTTTPGGTQNAVPNSGSNNSGPPPASAPMPGPAWSDGTSSPPSAPTQTK